MVDGALCGRLGFVWWVEVCVVGEALFGRWGFVWCLELCGIGMWVVGLTK